MFDASATAASPIRSRSSGLSAGLGLSSIELLVPPLHRAVPLAEVHDPAEAVAHDLDLDVPRVLQVLLDVHRAVAERRQRLVLGQAEELGELLGIGARSACPCRRHPPWP